MGSIYWINKCNILSYSFIQIFTKDFQRNRMFSLSLQFYQKEMSTVFQNCSKSSKGGRRIIYEHNITGISPELEQEIPCVIVLGENTNCDTQILCYPVFPVFSPVDYYLHPLTPAISPSPWHGFLLIKNGLEECSCPNDWPMKREFR